MYNKIGKIKIDSKRNVDEQQLLKVPAKIKKGMEYILAFNCSKEICKQPLRDDHACLLVWSAEVIGLHIPQSLKRFLVYLQENHCPARWITTACGYVRIYYTVVGTDILNSKQMKDLEAIYVSLF